MRKNIFLLVGKSSVGKTVIEQELGKLGIHRAISFTSRPKRSSEIEGNEYFFVDNDTINDKLEKNELYEITKYEVDGEVWQYALAKESFDFNLLNVATVNPDGMFQLLDNAVLSEKIHILVITSSDETREKRYLERETSPKKISNWKERKIQDNIDFVLNEPFKGIENISFLENDGSMSVEEVALTVFEEIKKKAGIK